ncbi:MAG: FecR domain-containing protein [Pseudanabaena sp. ELA607]
MMPSHRRLWLLFGTGSLATLASVLGCELGYKSWDDASLNVSAQSSIQATVIEIVDGNEVYVQGKTAPVNTIAYAGQTVTTGESRTQLQFGDQAIARLSKNSRLTLGRCTQLERGSILVSGPVSTCTTNITAAVRGTTYYLEANENDEEDLQVLEGEVEVTDRHSASLRQLRVKAGQRFRFRRSLAREAFANKSVINLSNQDYDNILQGGLGNNFRNDLPTLAKVRASHRRLFPKAVFPERQRHSPARVPLPIRLPKLS